MTAPISDPVYVDAPSGPVFGMLHRPRGAADPGASAILMCSPFGNAELCSHRSRREWATRLAAAGHPTLRFDLPGTGDSAGGPHDPDLPDAWTAAVAACAGWLRETTGCRRVVAIAIGLGGVVAYRAVTLDAPIDDLVLWAVPARGRALVRELRALARFEVAQAGPPPLPPGSVASAGFVMSAQTVSELEALDLAALPLPRAQTRRVLVLGRDGPAVDERLVASLDGAGTAVETAAGVGYGAFVAPPQQSQAPVEVFELVERWLGDGAADRSATPASPGDGPPSAPWPAPTAAASADLTVDGRRVTETPFAIERPSGRLAGVLARGMEDVPACAVLLNAGALRRIGPNRLWVETARRWAARGVPTLRIDLGGIGDSDGDAVSLRDDAGLYVPRFVDEVVETLDELARRGLPERFVLLGLCSGAYWAFHAALRDERVVAAMMVNPRALVWDETLAPRRSLRELNRLRAASTWRKIVTGRASRQQAVELARSFSRLTAARMRSGAARDPSAAVADALELMKARNVELLLAFTAEEPVRDELVRSGALAGDRTPGSVELRMLSDQIAAHTLEPIVLQAELRHTVDGALERTLAKHGIRPRG